VIEPVDLKPFLRSAPTVMLLDWNQREPPTGAEIAALRLALDHIKLAVHFALVHDEGNAAPEQALERADRPNSPRRPLFLTASQIAAIVIGLSEFCSSSKKNPAQLERAQRSLRPRYCHIQRRGRANAFYADNRGVGGNHRRAELFAQQCLSVRAGRQG
jgi:hypothetical protein